MPRRRRAWYQNKIYTNVEKELLCVDLLPCEPGRCPHTPIRRRLTSTIYELITQDPIHTHTSDSRSVASRPFCLTFRRPQERASDPSKRPQRTPPVPTTPRQERGPGSENSWQQDASDPTKGGRPGNWISRKTGAQWCFRWPETLAVRFVWAKTVPSSMDECV